MRAKSDLKAQSPGHGPSIDRRSIARPRIGDAENRDEPDDRLRARHAELRGSGGRNCDRCSGAKRHQGICRETVSA